MLVFDSVIDYVNDSVFQAASLKLCSFLNNRFEHYDGAKAVELSPGRLAIINHRWMEPSYAHIWERL
jgi:hypothetical protein